MGPWSFFSIIPLTQTHSSPRGKGQANTRLCHNYVKLFLLKARTFILNGACLRVYVCESASVGVPFISFDFHCYSFGSLGAVTSA